MQFFPISPRAAIKRQSRARALLGNTRLPIIHSSGTSDAAMIKRFVTTLNRGDMDLCDIVTLGTKVVVDKFEFDLDFFLDIVHQHATTFPHIELTVIGGAVRAHDTSMTTVAVAYCDIRAEPEASLLSSGAPEALQFVVKEGKLAKIHWKALGKSSNSDGLISFVKKHFVQQ